MVSPLQVTDLAWGYGARDALGRGLTWMLAPGGSVAVVGPNGAGKTALLRTLAGRLPPLAGEVRLSGADATALSPVQRSRRVAMLPQSPPLDLELTVHEMVSLGRTPHLGWWGRLGADDHDAIAQALARCDLESLAHRRLGQLSGGERQRAQLAMTVAQRASLLLLDEPTTHLDLLRRHELFELLATLRAQTGVAVVMVLHDLAEAYREAQQVLVIADGRAEAIGAAQADRERKLAAAFGVPSQRLGL